jgi:hypothetical protein
VLIGIGRMGDHAAGSRLDGPRRPLRHADSAEVDRKLDGDSAGLSRVGWHASRRPMRSAWTAELDAELHEDELNRLWDARERLLRAHGPC